MFGVQYTLFIIRIVIIITVRHVCNLLDGHLYLGMCVLVNGVVVKMKLWNGLRTLTNTKKKHRFHTELSMVTAVRSNN